MIARQRERGRGAAGRAVGMSGWDEARAIQRGVMAETGKGPVHRNTQMELDCAGFTLVKPADGSPCNDDASGNLTLSVNIQGVEYALGGPAGGAGGGGNATSRVFLGTTGQAAVVGGSSAAAPVNDCLVAQIAVRAARRFTDSKGNLWGPTGAYLGSHSAAARSTTYVYVHAVDGTCADRTYINNCNYTVGTIGPPNFGTQGSFGFDAGVGSAGTWCIRGLGASDDGCGLWQSDDIVMCIEADITTSFGSGPDDYSPQPYHVIARSYADLVAKLAMSAPQPLSTYLAGLAAGSEIAVPVRTATVLITPDCHVTPAPDGTFWVHQPGRKVLQQYYYRHATTDVVMGESVTLGAGGTAWTASGSGATIVNVIA